eukprot:398448_1
MASSHHNNKSFFILIWCTLAFTAHPWSYDSVLLWADLYTRDQPNSMLTDYQAEFLATHYRFLSIEKCLSVDGAKTEQSFYRIASHLHQYDNTTKVLFYWNAMKCYCGCYEITRSFYNDKSMWLYDESGNPIYQGAGTGQPYFDHTQQKVRDWWVSSLVTVLSNALSQGIQVDGVFVDAVRCAFRGRLSAARTQQYKEGMYALLAAARQELKKLNENMFVLANGMHFHCHPIEVCANMSHLMDGTSIEHFAAYEQTDRANAYPNTYINVQSVKSIFDISKLFLDQGIAVFVKGFIGPETTPISRKYGYPSPAWPSGYQTPGGFGYPTNRMEIRNVATTLLDYPLAMFLCGIYNEEAYFSYGWYWDSNGGYVPCPDQMSKCNAPNEWYPQFLNALGAPTSPANVLYDGNKCSRSFEHATVYVDLEDETSVNIVWIPTTTTMPTSAPTTSVPTTSIPSSMPFKTLSQSVTPDTQEGTTSPKMHVSGRKASSDNTLLIELILFAVFIFCVGSICIIKYMHSLRQEVNNVNDQRSVYNAYARMDQLD